MSRLRPAQVAAVILAAGAGRRFGGPKAGLCLRGRWMLPRLVHSLRVGGAGRVDVVLSEPALAALHGRPSSGADRHLINPDPDAGRTGSLQVALRALEDDPGLPEVLVVHPVDIPLLRAEVVDTLLRAWARAEDGHALAVRPVTAGGRGGHPLLLGRERQRALLAFPPDRPLRDLVHADPAQRLDVRVEGDPGPFLDVDTPEQAQFLEGLLLQEEEPEP